MADLDDVEFALEEISEKLTGIHEALHEIKEGGTGRTVGEWVGVLFVVFLFSSWSGSAVDRWTDKVWYSIVDNADFKNITVSKRPVDCDFFHAPIGNKGCAYDKKTEVFDDKKRQQLINQATTVEERQGYEKLPNSVMVYWEKKQEGE